MLARVESRCGRLWCDGRICGSQNMKTSSIQSSSLRWQSTLDFFGRRRTDVNSRPGKVVLIHSLGFRGLGFSGTRLGHVFGLSSFSPSFTPILLTRARQYDSFTLICGLVIVVGLPSCRFQARYSFVTKSLNFELKGNRSMLDRTCLRFSDTFFAPE